MTTTPWAASEKAREFRDKRLQFRDKGPKHLMEFQVRAFRGVVWRKADGKVEQQHCEHAHSKRTSAAKCAEGMAKRMNRKGEQA